MAESGPGTFRGQCRTGSGTGNVTARSPAYSMAEPSLAGFVVTVLLPDSPVTLALTAVDIHGVCRYSRRGGAGQTLLRGLLFDTMFEW